MQKTFTVHSFYHKQVSPGKGSIIWLVSDEEGKPRKVNAVTSINPQSEIEQVIAVYKREIPLVERLKMAEKGDTISVDFTEYNQQHKYEPRQVYDDMRNREQAGALAGNVRKYLLVLGAVALLWFTYTALTDVSSMEMNFFNELSGSD